MRHVFRSRFGLLVPPHPSPLRLGSGRALPPGEREQIVPPPWECGHLGRSSFFAGWKPALPGKETHPAALRHPSKEGIEKNHPLSGGVAHRAGVGSCSGSGTNRGNPPRRFAAPLQGGDRKNHPLSGGVAHRAGVGSWHVSTKKPTPPLTRHKEEACPPTAK